MKVSLLLQAVGLDASSTESRTDVIIIALSAVLLLTGLQWLALRPVEKEAVRCRFQGFTILLYLTATHIRSKAGEPYSRIIVQVDLQGKDVEYAHSSLSSKAVKELNWYATLMFCKLRSKQSDCQSIVSVSIAKHKSAVPFDRAFRILDWKSVAIYRQLFESNFNLQEGDLWLDQACLLQNLICRAYEALAAATRCRALVVFFKDTCILYKGKAETSADPSTSKPGPICQRAMEKEQGNYLANLALYPGEAGLLKLVSSRCLTLLWNAFKAGGHKKQCSAGPEAFVMFTVNFLL